ncbi:hypothetical protein [Allosphingosinicella indica]|uniref:Uncharacterized protein n=1 Tax=Allosphingosinicella indica TaxID=941907 RepID=A0A1X7GJB9_9SPHN|nr:hypothetical protein [Allosphingosinicella indica]SMF70620.1 hypothetical protein SAMN06295910_1909 [Allosphingosinicella indica]
MTEQHRDSAPIDHVQSARDNLAARRALGSETVWLSCDTVDALLRRIEAAPSSDSASTVEKYEELILVSPEPDAEADAFMRGFAYGRFSTMDSELALHWGILRRFQLDHCPIVYETPNILALNRNPDPEVERLADQLDYIVSAWATAHDIYGVARNALMKSLRAALSSQALVPSAV